MVLGVHTPGRVGHRRAFFGPSTKRVNGPAPCIGVGPFFVSQSAGMPKARGDRGSQFINSAWPQKRRRRPLQTKQRRRPFRPAVTVRAAWGGLQSISFGQTWSTGPRPKARQYAVRRVARSGSRSGPPHTSGLSPSHHHRRSGRNSAQVGARRGDTGNSQRSS